MKVLQTFALPLGYGTRKNGAVDETRTRDLHLGKVALYQLSYYRMCSLVRATRLELTRLAAPDPKSGASAIPPRPHGTKQNGANQIHNPERTIFIIQSMDALVNSFFCKKPNFGGIRLEPDSPDFGKAPYSRILDVM